MKTYQVTISDERAKAIEAHIESISEWLQHAIDNKGRQCEDRIVEIISDKQPKKMAEGEKLAIIQSIEIEPYSEERQAKSLHERIVK